MQYGNLTRLSGIFNICMSFLNYILMNVAMVENQLEYYAETAKFTTKIKIMR